MSAIDLARAIKKACSLEEVEPKRKHVRACILYTWDHKSATQFFSILKSMPLAASEVQVFKCLILVHKVVQEGHPSVLKEAIRNVEWVRSLGRVPSNEYGRMIQRYSNLICEKLMFQASHRGFDTGTFEYKEYTSLAIVSDPDIGYDTISGLMDLLDEVVDTARLMVANTGRRRNSELIVASLVPLITESYGIYRFEVPLLKALTQEIDEQDALRQLKNRYTRQHSVVFELYADCSSIKSLVSLINLPKLPLEAEPFDMPDKIEYEAPPEVLHEAPYEAPQEAPKVLSADQRLAVHLALQSINHSQEPVSYYTVSQLANDIAVSTEPSIPAIIRLTHQFTTLLQRYPSPLLAQASQLYFQALLSPSQQDIINANTNLQNLLINSPAHIFDPPTPQTHTSA